MDTPSKEDLIALNVLVQCGFVDVVAIEDGQPVYQLAARLRKPKTPRICSGGWKAEGSSRPHEG